MAATFTAKHDPALEARVTESHEMVYADGPSEDDDRPPHVLAASGLSAFREHLAVVQDDANWVALIDAEQKITAVPLPPGPDGKRVFTKSRGNADNKYDFEACITVPGEHGLELIGFASCSEPERVWILRICETGARDDEGGPKFHSEFINAKRFYEMLRQETAFSGAGLNIEGAVTLDDERIVLFQRGNAEPRGGLQPVDAMAELSWTELRRFLSDPDNAPVPPIKNIRTYDLGDVDGIRLTFSDAEHLGGGRILYSASAEDPDSDKIAGSVLGILEPDGTACWTQLIDQDGSDFTGKIEGLTRDTTDENKIYFVIDDDDDQVPSKIYHAVINDRFLR